MGVASLHCTNEWCECVFVFLGAKAQTNWLLFNQTTTFEQALLQKPQSFYQIPPSFPILATCMGSGINNVCIVCPLCVCVYVCTQLKYIPNIKSPYIFSSFTPPSTQKMLDNWSSRRKQLAFMYCILCGLTKKHLPNTFNTTSFFFFVL